jgi:hypothetical protein
VGGPNQESLPPVTDEAIAALTSYSQGEILELTTLPVIRPWPPLEASPLSLGTRLRKALRSSQTQNDTLGEPAPSGSAVLSQTCDIAQPDRLTVQIAPLARLAGQRANEAAIGRRPRYVPLPNADDSLFIDLESIVTVHKNDLAGVAHKPGVNNTREGRKLAQAIGRRFTRFPFPDELHPWLRPLEDLLQKKADRPSSPLGIALASVAEIRIEAQGSWESPPYTLTVLVVVEQGILPYGPDDNPEQPKVLGNWLRDVDGSLIRSATQIAEKLNASTDASERYYLWLALGEAWADQCRPGANESESIHTAVDSIDGEVLSADDLTMDRWWGSEALDLDHLSPPRPK